MTAILWDEHAAAHLLRRTGFGATSEEIAGAVDDGFDRTVDRLVNYGGVSNADLDARLASAQLDLATPGGLIRWWVIRMLHTARPLEERLTFFLHDHFATAIYKVKQPQLMLRQNELLRRHATGRFVDLTIEISRDPAMLIWLDNYRSTREHPNENYGRELLELFTLGHGNYTEEDVLAAAKAFTGWTLSRETFDFVFVDRIHDHSIKTFLGHTGDWNGDDIVRFACDEEAHGRLIAGKLFAWFAYENPADDVVDRFARIYLDSGTDLRLLVDAILRSDEMYSQQARWSRVKSPVDFVTSVARHFGIVDSRTDGLAAAALRVQGQVPFNPPDVDGWPDGSAWINAGTLLNRMNFAGLLSSRLDLTALDGSEPAADTDALVDLYLRHLGGVVVSDATRGQLAAYVESSGGYPTGEALLAKKRGLAQMIVSLPEWQLN